MAPKRLRRDERSRHSNIELNVSRAGPLGGRERERERERECRAGALGALAYR